MPHRTQVLQPFEALLSFPLVRQVFPQYLLEYTFSAVVKYQCLVSLNRTTQAPNINISTDKEISTGKRKERVKDTKPNPQSFMQVV